MRRYDRVLAAIAGPWAIEPTAGQQLLDILNRRLAGEEASAVDLAAAAEVRAARDQRKAKGKPRGVAVLPLHGPMVKRADVFSDVSGLTSTEQLGQWVDAAATDPSIEAVVLDVDSPGGSVFGVEELSRQIEAAGKKKKVIAVVNAMAASAAYYAASQASELVVSPSGMVGSIGVVMKHTDDSERAKASGRTVTIIATSDKKAAGIGGPLNAAGRADIEEMVGGYYEQFVRAVARGRNVTQTKVREDFGGGGMVLAEKAVRLGMADRVATLDEVLARYGMSAADLTPVGAAGEAAPTAATDAGSEDRRKRLRATYEKSLTTT